MVLAAVAVLANANVPSALTLLMLQAFVSCWLWWLPGLYLVLLQPFSIVVNMLLAFALLGLDARGGAMLPATIKRSSP